MRRGFHYLVAIMDWSTRKVLSWRLSNTMDADFCIEALGEALMRFGRPEIFNTASGKIIRHRINRGGDRAANSGLHIIAIGRLRTDSRTKAYVARRIAEGYSTLEAIRCVKRGLTGMTGKQKRCSADFTASRHPG